MVIKAFSTGMLLSLGLILPLGAQNTFVLDQGLRAQRLISIAIVVIIASLCDTFLIIAAALGLTLTLSNYHWAQTMMLFVGASFLWLLSYRAWQDNPSSDKTDEIQQAISLPKLALLTLSVSLINPYAIIDTMMTIGSVSLTYQASDKVAFLTACILLSWLWFTFLSCVGRWLKKFKLFNEHRGKISSPEFKS